MRHPTVQTFVASAAALAAGAGCQNPGTTISGAGPNPLPDLAPQTEAPGRDGGPRTLEGTPPDQIPTRTTTLDRSGWPTETVRQPRGQVEVQPTYYRLFEGFSGDPRATGAYPTASSALRYHGAAPTAVTDGAAQPVIGIFWLAGTPIALVAGPPNTVRREPAAGIEWLPNREAAAPR